MSKRAAVFAALLACMLFLLVPLTQSLTPPPKRDLVVRETAMVPPPPPKLPPIEEPPPETPRTPPVLQTPKPAVELRQLQLALEPSHQDALSMGTDLSSFTLAVDVVAEIQKVFSFDELDTEPRVLIAPKITYPEALRRMGIRQGTVELIVLIDATGRVKVESIVSSTHPQFEALAKRTAENFRFTPPTVNGKPVPVRRTWPLTIQAP